MPAVYQSLSKPCQASERDVATQQSSLFWQDTTPRVCSGWFSALNICSFKTPPRIFGCTKENLEKNSQNGFQRKYKNTETSQSILSNLHTCSHANASNDIHKKYFCSHDSHISWPSLPTTGLTQFRQHLLCLNTQKQLFFQQPGSFLETGPPSGHCFWQNGKWMTTLPPCAFQKSTSFGHMFASCASTCLPAVPADPPALLGLPASFFLPAASFFCFFFSVGAGFLSSTVCCIHSFQLYLQICIQMAVAC